MACLRSPESSHSPSIFRVKDIGSFIRDGVERGRVEVNFSSALQTKMFSISLANCPKESESLPSAENSVVCPIKSSSSAEVSAGPLPFFHRWTHESPK